MYFLFNYSTLFSTFLMILFCLHSVISFTSKYIAIATSHSSYSIPSSIIIIYYPIIIVLCIGSIAPIAASIVPVISFGYITGPCICFIDVYQTFLYSILIEYIHLNVNTHLIGYFNCFLNYHHCITTIPDLN